MAKHFTIFKQFVNAGIQQALSYRVNTLFWVFGDIMYCFVSLFIWKAIFLSSKSEIFMGFSLEQMIVYIFLMYLTNMLVSSYSSYAIGEEILDGSISMRLIKPISYNATFLFQELGNKLITLFIVFTPLIVGVEVYNFFTTGAVVVKLHTFLLFTLSSCLAYLINFYFNICYGFTAFVFKNMWGSSMMKNTIVGFLSGMYIPLSFFPEMAAKVLTILPFASLAYTPVMVYIGVYKGKELAFYIGLQIFWCVFFWLLSKLIWSGVHKRLTVQGG